jgi:apolipoprotein N-acyltransferase
VGRMGGWRGGITPPPPRSGALTAGAGSAILFALALPPHPLPILLVPAFLLLAEAVRMLPRGRAGFQSGALLGALFGGLHSLLVLHWLPSAGWSHLGPMAVAAALGVWGFHAVVGMGVLGAVAAARVPRPLALIPGWAVLVWLPGVIPILGVPWPGPELALVEWPGAAALLPFLGSAGLGALVAGTAASLLALGRTGVGVALLVPLLWGLVEARGEPGVPGSRDGAEEGGGSRIALVEMAFPPSVVQDPAIREARILEAMSRRLHDGPDSDQGPVGQRAALLPEAWPEAPVPPAAAPHGDGVSSGDRYLSALQARVESRHVSLVTGSHVIREGRRRNGVLRLEAGEEIRSVHEKSRLVPGVERTAFLGAGRPGRGLAPGDHQPPFPWVGRSVGVLICFEVLFPGEVARLRREGAHLLLQLSNDSALRPEAGPFPVLLDAGRRQHEAFLRARATEFALPVLRSVMGARAGGWDARGRALPELQRWGDGELTFVVVRIPDAGPIPPAAWLSPLTGPVAAAALLFALSLPGLPRLRRATRPSQGAVP